MQDAVTTPQWEEENSQDFIDYGKYFVPDREIQINCICEVIPPPSESAYILDLCCGEGLLTRALLGDRPPNEFGGNLRKLMRKRLWNSESDWLIQRRCQQSC